MHCKTLRAAAIGGELNADVHANAHEFQLSGFCASHVRVHQTHTANIITRVIINMAQTCELTVGLSRIVF